MAVSLAVDKGDGMQDLLLEEGLAELPGQREGPLSGRDTWLSCSGRND
jgi:hypothetical protein